MTLTVAPFLLSAFLMATVRAGAFMLLAPPFNSRMVPTTVKVGFSAAIGVHSAPRLVDAQIPLEVGSLVTGALLQIGTGLAMGFMVLLLFLAISAAGSFMDVLGGLAIMPAFDPLQNQQATLLGRFYSVVATTLLFAVGGHLLIVRGFLTSFEAVPLGGLRVDGLGLTLADQIGRFFVSALEIAGPIIGVLFVTEVAMGLMAKAAPQMNVFLVGMPLKILLTLLVVALTLPFVVGGLDALLEQGVGTGLQLIGVR